MSLYRQAFGLRAEPFHVTPDPAFLFLTPQHREALAGLVYSIAERKGFIMLTGPAGTGKTTLARKVLQGAYANAVDSSVVLNPALSASEFLEAVLLDFGVREIPASKAQRMWIFQRLLLESHRRGRTAVLLVDEAHKLSPDLVEEMRLWGNFEFADRKLLQIVLVGQSELVALVDRPELEQFKQRIVLRFVLRPLAENETFPYLRHRWAKAGGGEKLPFTQGAIEGIAEVSSGIPRLINTIADNALLLAFGQGLMTVAENHVLSAAKGLGLSVRPLPNGRGSENGSEPRPLGSGLNRDSYPLHTLEMYAARPRWWGRRTGT